MPLYYFFLYQNVCIFQLACAFICLIVIIIIIIIAIRFDTIRFPRSESEDFMKNMSQKSWARISRIDSFVFRMMPPVIIFSSKMQYMPKSKIIVVFDLGRRYICTNIRMRQAYALQYCLVLHNYHIML